MGVMMYATSEQIAEAFTEDPEGAGDALLQLAVMITSSVRAEVIISEMSDAVRAKEGVSDELKVEVLDFLEQLKALS